MQKNALFTVKTDYYSSINATALSNTNDYITIRQAPD